MEFANKYVLILLPFALVFAIMLAAWAADRRKAALSALLGGREKWRNKVVVSPFKRQVKWLLLLVAITFSALAAARPWWGTIRAPGSGRGRDIVFVIDVSKSMLAEDVAPSRLAHAKFVANRIMEDNPHDRFAIVAFAGNAILSCPLTNDRGSLELFLKELDPDAIPLGGTNLQAALELVIRVFSGAVGNTRAVVMLTDGEELSGNANSLLARLQSEHIPIYVMGVGNPSEPAMIPLRDERGQVSYLRDRAGNLVQTKLNPELLSGIARATGGEYIPSTAVNSGVEEVDHYLKKLSTANYEEREKPRIIERFMPFLVAAALALLASLLISERPARKVALLVVAALAINPLCGQATDEAAPPPAKTSEREPWLIYDEAREAQLADDPATAEAKYLEAIGGVGKSQEAVRLYGYHNLGVIDHKRARESVSNAKDLLARQDPDGALKSLNQAEEELAKAEELYVNSLHYSGATGVSAPTAEAQQQLLLDREEVEQLIKQIEELKEQQEQARQSAQQAKEQMQQQQPEDQSGEEGSESDGQGESEGDQGEDGQDQRGGGENQPSQAGGGQGKEQPSQPQDQSGEEGEDDRGQQKHNSKGNDASEALNNARNEAEKLADQADELGQSNTSDRANRAKDELEKAAEAEKSGDRDKAREHLNNALNELGSGDGDNGEEPREQSSSNSQGRDGESQPPEEPQNGSPQDGESGEYHERPDDGTEDGQPGNEEQNHQSMNELDDDMVDQLLDRLNQDERDLRDQLNRRNRIPSTVEKDW